MSGERRPDLGEEVGVIATAVSHTLDDHWAHAEHRGLEVGDQRWSSDGLRRRRDRVTETDVHLPGMKFFGAKTSASDRVSMATESGGDTRYVDPSLVGMSWT